MYAKAKLTRLKLMFHICNVIGYIESNIAQMERKFLLKSLPDSQKMPPQKLPISVVSQSRLSVRARFVHCSSKPICLRRYLN